jgi:hypothetical protein
VADISLYCFFWLILWLTPDAPGDPAKREAPVEGIRIAWDRSTLQQLSPRDARYAGYARMIVLQDASLFCVYECQGGTHAIRSFDNAGTWTKPMIVAAPENGISRVVPEVLQLKDRSILVSYNLRPPGNNTDPSKRFAIEVRRSEDGEHWSGPVRVYTAGHEFSNGCWEPAQLQLPSREIQLFIANEGPYTQTNEQEITMFRSMDNGASWTSGKKMSFRSKHRDGMPVPLQLRNGKEIIYAIEDNGIEGNTFKPVIIRTEASGAWNNAPVLADSKDRMHALETRNRVPATAYAGAPYIRQLLSGETILSYQSTEWRHNAPWDRSDMVVAIGDEEGKNFNRKSRPFYFTDSLKTCLWNSITVLNDTTMIALGSTNGFSDNTGVWMIKGYVIRPANAQHRTLQVDGKFQEKAWQESLPLFIGGYGMAQARIGLAWDDARLYILAYVKDSEVISNDTLQRNDGLRFYLDPGNRSTAGPAKGVFTLAIDASGAVDLAEGDKGEWIPRKSSPIVQAVKPAADGYRVRIGIPWSVLGTKPGRKIRFHAILNNIAAEGHAYHEPLSGNENEKPYTWLPVNLID